jgi:hypothetical protein
MKLDKYKKVFIEIENLSTIDYLTGKVLNFAGFIVLVIIFLLCNYKFCFDGARTQSFCGLLSKWRKIRF